MQQNAITALAVASQNEELQQALNNTRQELLKAQKETYELRAKLTESQEEVARLEAEMAQRHTTQAPSNDYTTNQGRVNGQAPQMANTAAPGVYPTPTYQHAGNQMYQNHPAPSQGISLCSICIFMKLTTPKRRILEPQRIPRRIIGHLSTGPNSPQFRCTGTQPRSRSLACGIQICVELSIIECCVEFQLFHSSRPVRAIQLEN
jgi:hypothetical protein